MKTYNNKTLTKVRCEFTSCIYNNACCCVPMEEYAKNSYCTKDQVSIVLENNKCKCKDFKFDKDKKTKCVRCQLKDYGYVSLELRSSDNEEVNLNK